MARTPISILILLALSLPACSTGSSSLHSVTIADPPPFARHGTASFAALTPSSDLRRVEDPRSGLRSVLLRPSATRMVFGSHEADRPVVLLGALYAVAPGPGVETAALALVIRVMGGDLKSALESGAGIRVMADGLNLVRQGLIAPEFYSSTRETGGVVETLMVPILPTELKTIAAGADVLVSLGDAIGFGVTRAQQSGLAAMVGEIPENMHFGRRLVAPPRRFSASD